MSECDCLHYGWVKIQRGKYANQIGLYDDDDMETGRAIVYPISTRGYVTLHKSWLAQARKEDVPESADPTLLLLGMQ